MIKQLVSIALLVSIVGCTGSESKTPTADSEDFELLAARLNRILEVNGSQTTKLYSMVAYGNFKKSLHCELDVYSVMGSMYGNSDVKKVQTGVDTVSADIADISEMDLPSGLSLILCCSDSGTESEHTPPYECKSTVWKP
jgi:hypothetical protein